MPRDAAAPPRRRALYWLAILVGYAVVLGGFFWRVFARGQMCGWDCIDEYWPDLVFQSRSLADGELPLWNPYVHGGYAFYADPQAGVLTPVNWLCMVISFVIGVGPALIQIKFFLLFYAALVGMHVLVWRSTRCHAAAAIAALVFVFGGPMLVHKNSALIWPLLLLPWAVAAFDAFRELPSKRRGILLGLAVAMVIVSQPPGGFYAALILAAYTGFHAVRGLLARADVRRLVPGLACAAFVGGAWTATVYLPTWGTVDSSARATRTIEWALSQPLPTKALRELFVPALDTNWMLDIYLGPLAVILLVWLAVVRPEGRLWLGVAGFSILLALGAAGHLLPWLATHVPGFGLFRIAYRYKLITGFAGAIAAGQAIGMLARTPLTLQHKRVLLGVAAAWAVACVAITRTVPTLPAILAVLALCAVVLDRASRRRWWLVALVAFTLVDLSRAADVKMAILQPRPATDRGSALLAQMPGVTDTWRFYATRYAGSGGTLPIPYHAAPVQSVREISGFEHPLVSQRMLDVLAAAPKQLALLTHFNTKYFIGAGPPGSTLISGTPIHVAADVAPIARLYSRAELLPRDQILARLGQLAPSAMTAALVEPADAPAQLPSAELAPVTGRVVAFERNRLVIDIDAPAPGILVINEAWSPQWRATIDGNATEVFRANYLLRAVVVPAGSHRVELALSAPVYRTMVIVPVILALLGVIALIARALLRRRRAS